MSTLPLSVTIICRNEEEKIRKAIHSVRFADEILVVDCGSTDRTVELAQQAGARVIHHEWQGYGQQKNFAQDQTRNLWVLNIDADESVSDEMCERIQEILSAPLLADGYEFPRRNYYGRHWVRYGGWYPNYLVRMARKDRARWSEPRVHEALQVQGLVQRINAPLDHASFGGVHDQVLTNVRFSKLGMEELIAKGKAGSVGLLVFKPWWKFVDAYFFRQGFRDGLPGFVIAVNAAHSMFMKYAALLEVRGEGTDRRQ